MGDGNLLSLRWNNHISNFKFTLGQLQQRDLYSDATIACEGNFFPVHKFVLSTCSDYFASMFERTPCKHPVIVLKDVSSKDIEFLLSYMYGGEVSVGQTDLPSLIRAAETLQIKGLAAHDDPPNSPGQQGHKKTPSPAETEDKPAKRPRLSSSSEETRPSSKIKEEADEDYSEATISEAEPDNEKKNEDSVTLLPFTNTNVTQINTENNFYEDSNFPELQLKRESEISMTDSSNSREESRFQSEQGPPQSSSLSAQDGDCISWPASFLPCNTPSGMDNGVVNSGTMNHRPNPLYQPPNPTSGPGGVSNTRVGDTGVKTNGNVTNYINMAGMLPPFPGENVFRCPLCEYVTHNRSWVDIHLRKHTGEKPFACPYCSFRSAQRGNLNVHIRKIHSKFSGTPRVRIGGAAGSVEEAFLLTQHPPLPPTSSGTGGSMWPEVNKERQEHKAPAVSEQSHVQTTNNN